MAKSAQIAKLADIPANAQNMNPDGHRYIYGYATVINLFFDTILLCAATRRW